MSWKRASSRSPALALFGSVFLLAGLGMLLFLVVPQIHDWLRMQTWQPVTGEILSLRLNSHRSDDSTTYSVTAEYRYRYDGREWTGDRVGIGSGSDNIGSYHQDLHRRLSASRTVTVWVNPHAPAEAVLDREMRWAMLSFLGLFVVIFGGVGLLLVINGLRRAKDGELPRGTAAADAKQWLAERGDNRIVAGGITKAAALWGFGLAAAAFSAPGLYFMRDELLRGQPEALAVLAFLAVSVGLLIAAVHATREYRRYGRLELVLDPYPGAIGGEFGATLDLRERFDSRTLFPVSLACLRTYTTGSGKNRSTRTSTIWHAEGFAQTLPAGSGTRLGIRFAVPPGLPASEPASSDYHSWHLNVEASVPGIDLKRDFTVPMLPGSETARELAHVEFADRAGPPPEIPPSILRIRGGAGGTEFLYPAGRHKGMALVFGSIGIVFGAVARFVAQDVGGWNFGVLVFVGIFGLFAALLTLLALYMPFTSLAVTVSPGGITTQRRWFGLTVGRRHVARDDLDRIERKQEMETRIGTRSIIHYRLEAHDRTGKRVTIGESLRGNRIAALVTERVQQALDLRPPQSPPATPGSRWTDR